MIFFVLKGKAKPTMLWRVWETPHDARGTTRGGTTTRDEASDNDRCSNAVPYIAL